ncbi:hypothetical protein [Mesorhizobium sp.]|uniref:hypothetical protein n=1 Tax=Mesorhizobium sp. TaxID=1871066 RepID=UPI000FE70ADD|nr:hypothetical protein [Mesorhizobium sp.]RWC59490.1 MAG: hypothetical protein EOS29_21930 [Mesorhizobium sp.]RWC60471.1 MAG: hypothetical protein EOS56_14370 [Mesorhizobium sp.]
MFKTPPIPDSIRRLKPPLDFVNPFQIGIDGPNLFGTETLCGDWGGTLLLLAQDFAPADEVRAVQKKHGSKGAWRHNDGDGRYGIGMITNENICRHLKSIGRNVDLAGRKSLDCGVLYGNASFFLKEGNVSPTKGVRASAPVFEFVIENMSDLKAIACLGKPAFEGVMGWLGINADWRMHMNARKPVRYGELSIFALAHPGQLGINGRLPSAIYSERLGAIEADWRAIGKALD